MQRTQQSWDQAHGHFARVTPKKGMPIGLGDALGVGLHVVR